MILDGIRYSWLVLDPILGIRTGIWEKQNCGGKDAQTDITHIVPELSEGRWGSSLSVMHFCGSYGAKDPLPGH